MASFLRYWFQISAHIYKIISDYLSIFQDVTHIYTYVYRFCMYVYICVCILKMYIMYIIYNIYNIYIKIIALTLVLSFHPDSICQGAPPKSHASFVTGPETSLAAMAQPVTPQSWKLQLTMSLITITSFFQQKKTSQIILSCTFFG